MSKRLRRVAFAKAFGVLVLGSVVGISAQSGQGGGQTGRPAPQGGGSGQQQVRRDARGPGSQLSQLMATTRAVVRDVGTMVRRISQRLRTASARRCRP